MKSRPSFPLPPRGCIWSSSSPHSNHSLTSKSLELKVASSIKAPNTSLRPREYYLKLETWNALVVVTSYRDHGRGTLLCPCLCTFCLAHLCDLPTDRPCPLSRRRADPDPCPLSWQGPQHTQRPEQRNRVGSHLRRQEKEGHDNVTLRGEEGKGGGETKKNKIKIKTIE